MYRVAITLDLKPFVKLCLDFFPMICFSITNIGQFDFPVFDCILQHIIVTIVNVTRSFKPLLYVLVKVQIRYTHQLVLWEPTEGKRSRGRRRINFIDNLLHDADADNTTKLRMVMEEREEWRKLVDNTGRPNRRPR